MRQDGKPAQSFTLSLTAGVLILINAVLLGVVVTWFPWVMPTIPGTSNDSVPFASLVATGLICGAVVLLGAVMLRIRPEGRRVWGIVVAAFSMPTVIMGGGLIIGFVLGIAGGILAIRRLKPEEERLER